MSGRNEMIVTTLIIVVILGYIAVSFEGYRSASDDAQPEERQRLQETEVGRRYSTELSSSSDPAGELQAGVVESLKKQTSVPPAERAGANAGVNEGARSDAPDSTLFEHSDYASYDKDTLTQLIANGDVIAMQVQAVRYLTEHRTPENVDRANKLLEEAIIHGATHYPFQFLAEQQSFDLLASLSKSKGMSEEKIRAALVDTFTYYELAAMRGNSSLKGSMVELYDRRFQLSPTDAEWDKIQSKAGELYQAYEKQRIDVGLGAFD